MEFAPDSMWLSVQAAETWAGVLYIVALTLLVLLAVFIPLSITNRWRRSRARNTRAVRLNILLGAALVATVALIITAHTTSLQSRVDARNNLIQEAERVYGLTLHPDLADQLLEGKSQNVMHAGGPGMQRAEYATVNAVLPDQGDVAITLGWDGYHWTLQTGPVGEAKTPPAPSNTRTPHDSTESTEQP